MTPRTYLNILTITSCLTIALISCGQSQTKKTDEIVITKNAQVDTSKTAIIAFDKNLEFPFDSSFNPTTLTQHELHNIDSLLVACVTDYNKSLDKDHKEWSIPLNNNNYFKQIIAVTNKKGQKEVWVNCFCVTMDNNKWKRDILIVEDGGNCYFNFKINLATMIFFDLRVNGVA